MNRNRTKEEQKKEKGAFITREKHHFRGWRSVAFQLAGSHVLGPRALLNVYLSSILHSGVGSALSSIHSFLLFFDRTTQSFDLCVEASSNQTTCGRQLLFWRGLFFVRWMASSCPQLQTYTPSAFCLLWANHHKCDLKTKPQPLLATPKTPGRNYGTHFQFHPLSVTCLCEHYVPVAVAVAAANSHPLTAHPSSTHTLDWQAHS